RDAGPLLQHVPRDDTGVVRGAAREDDDSPEFAKLRVREAEPFQLEPPVPNALAERLRNRVGLLVNLLQHERLVALLLGALVVRERIAQLAEVLDDAVEDDRDPVLVATGQRVGVLLRDPAVRGPARVSEPRARRGAVPAGRGLEPLQVAYGAHVVETVLLQQG